MQASCRSLCTNNRVTLNVINYRRQMFVGYAHFGAPWVFFTINPLEIRSPFCWKLCYVDFSPQHYPNPGEYKLVMRNGFEMIKCVQAKPFAQAIFI